MKRKAKAHRRPGGARAAMGRTSAAAIALLSLMLFGSRAGAVSFAMRGNVVAQGGNVTGGASNRIYGTVGQPAVGKSGGPNNNLCHGFWCFGGSRVLAVDDPPGGGCGCAIPGELSLSRAYPNPSRDEVRFELALPKAAEVRLAVYDVAGRRVDEISAAGMGAGYHTLSWRAPRGTAGIYFARLYVEHQMVGERRIVMVR